MVQAEALGVLGVLLRPALFQTTGDALEAPAVAEQEAALAEPPGALQGGFCGACPGA